ncbi:MAG: tRNA pseudouridine(38-40) synthase TruA [Candidatus Omnitrophica bacterium]|nr:tRNA pseudouridine(38-40) synthase TruA [Candidatus Omnitrophota bacterium]
MTNIKLTIEYDGTDFRGWQIQSRGERTVQAVIRDTFFQIFGENINLIGSGRTDSGVHAAGQVANFRTAVSKPPAEIRNALNAHLPKDVAILEAVPVPDEFHAQYSAKSKTYRYQILNREVRSPLGERTALRFIYPLDADLMQTAANELVGEHDFRSFKGTNRSNRNGNDVRIVSALKVRRRGDLITVEITANGFLYKMVRNIAGLLLECGAGRIPPREVRRILRARDRKAAPAAAPAHGLSLIKVAYPGRKMA